MTDDSVLNKITEIIEPLKISLKKLEDGQRKLEIGQRKLEDGQKKLEAGQKKLEDGQKRLEETVAIQGIDIKNIKQDVKNIDIKLVALNEKIDTKTDEITDLIGNILDNMVTQDQFDSLERRTAVLENKIITD